MDRLRAIWLSFRRAYMLQQMAAALRLKSREAERLRREKAEMALKAIQLEAELKGWRGAAECFSRQPPQGTNDNGETLTRQGS